MNEKELTNAVWRIYRKAITDIKALVKESGQLVFEDKYDFHRYVKYGENTFLDVEEIVIHMLEDKKYEMELVFASKENVESERKSIIKEELKRCDDKIQGAKRTIIENEERRKLLKKGKFENDN